MVWTVTPRINFVKNELESLLNGLTSKYNNDTFPNLNIYESDNEITLVAEIPGVDKNNVAITLKNNILTIAGKKSERVLNNETRIIRRERVGGSFDKSVRIPFRVNDSQISANYKDGILTITIPKAEEAKPKTITIN
jgi:HSP20 family protein